MSILPSGFGRLWRQVAATLKRRMCRESLLDLRAVGNDPRLALYLGKMQPLLLEARLDDGRGLPLFTFSRTGAHPFIRAARMGVEAMQGRNDPLVSIRKALDEFYTLVTPTDAAELLGLNREAGPFVDEPPWAAVMPWDGRSVQEWKEKIATWVRMENARSGKAGKPVTIEDGWAWCGPVSARKLNIESHRLLKVLRSVQKRGYVRGRGPHGDVRALVLLGERGEWRWLARTGQHRAAVVAALGQSSMPVRVEGLVDRRDVDLWPHVAGGVFSREAALGLFDRVFEGRAPRVVRPWLDAMSDAGVST